MRIPTLLLIAASLVAVDVTAEKAIRTQESAQRSVTASTSQTATSAETIAQELQYNLIGDPTEMQQVSDALMSMTKISSELKTMPWVQDRLANSRRSNDANELSKAADGQAELANKLAELAKKVQSAGVGDGMGDLERLIDNQQKIMDDTAKLADQTLGKDKKDLSPNEQAELNALANKENSIKDAIKDAIEALKENNKDIANKLENSKVGDTAKQASDKIADNQLADAQQSQQQIMDALQSAASNAPSDSLASLDKKMQEMSGLAQKQQDLLDQLNQTNDMSKEQADSMSAAEKNLANELGKLEEKTAEKSAGEASKDLSNRNKSMAGKNMEMTIKSIKSSLASMQSQMGQMAMKKLPDIGKPIIDSKEGAKEIGQDVGLENGQRNSKHDNAWIVNLVPKDREILNQVKSERFPKKYETLLIQYYRALANQLPLG